MKIKMPPGNLVLCFIHLYSYLSISSYIFSFDTASDYSELFLCNKNAHHVLDSGAVTSIKECSVEHQPSGQIAIGLNFY